MLFTVGIVVGGDELAGVQLQRLAGGIIYKLSQVVAFLVGISGRRWDVDWFWWGRRRNVNWFSLRWWRRRLEVDRDAGLDWDCKMRLGQLQSLFTLVVLLLLLDVLLDGGAGQLLRKPL